MVILNTIEVYTGVPGFLSFLGIILVLISLGYFLTNIIVDDLNQPIHWIINILLVFVAIIFLYIGFSNPTTQCLIYPNNVPLEEIEKEYEITEIEGLILKGYKKDEN